MEMLLSFVAGLVLAGIGAFFVLRSVKSAAAAAQNQALDDAAKQADVVRQAAVAKLEADLKNAQDNLEHAKKDAEKHTQELLETKDKAHKEAIEAIEKRHRDAMTAMEKHHVEAIEAEHKRYEQARGKHVGKQLFDHVRAYAEKLGCGAITLNVWEGNDAAMAFYRKLGMSVRKTCMEMMI